MTKDHKTLLLQEEMAAEEEAYFQNNLENILGPRAYLDFEPIVGYFYWQLRHKQCAPAL